MLSLESEIEAKALANFYADKGGKKQGYSSEISGSSGDGLKTIYEVTIFDNKDNPIRYSKVPITEVLE